MKNTNPSLQKKQKEKLNAMGKVKTQKQNWQESSCHKKRNITGNGTNWFLYRGFSSPSDFCNGGKQKKKPCHAEPESLNIAYAILRHTEFLVTTFWERTIQFLFSGLFLFKLFYQFLGNFICVLITFNPPRSFKDPPPSQPMQICVLLFLTLRTILGFVALYRQAWLTTCDNSLREN